MDTTPSSLSDAGCSDTVLSAFAKAVDAYPERIALREAGRTLTYAALDDASRRVAAALTRAGVGRGDRVALAADRSADAVVGMLGVLRRGAAFLPLDPAAPAPHRGELLARAKVAAILTHAAWPHAAPADDASPGNASPGNASPGNASPEDVPVLDIGAIVQAGAGDAAEWHDAPVRADDAAYIMFTSGSTGRPKGVVVPHRGIVRLAQAPRFVTVRPDDVLLQLAPLSFDASTFEVWGALLNGATLAIMPAGLASLDDIAAALREHRVTHLWLTAGLFHLMVDQRPEALAGLRFLLAGGDVLSPAHVRRAIAAMPAGRLVNGYGPTENTTFTCCWTAPRDWAGDDVPIGRPIDGTRVHILDAWMRPVPPGTIGELWAGGRGVALGYLDDPEATARAFPPDPFSDRPGSHLYRTGDLVREDEAGDIRFVGRIDDQVKIDGHRVEPGAIEAVLGTLPGVRQAVAVPRRRADGRAEMIAFVAGAGLDGAALRRGLAGLLPPAQVPARVEVVAALPLGRTGKVDRRALLAGLDRPAAAPAEASVGPDAAALEAAVAAAWAEGLGRADVPRDVNFFDLGGTSLQLVGVHAALARAFPGRLSITDMFALPTVRRQAGRLAGAVPAAAAAAAEAGRAPVVGGAVPIAIIGMAGRFPGAPDLDTFWRNIRDGVESISAFGKDEIEDAFGRSLADDPRYVRARGMLDGVELFDAGFFGFLPREAALTDPQQRLFLEVAWEALEDAGYDPRATTAKIGVFAGASINTYLLGNLMADAAQRQRFTGTYQTGEMATLVGNGSDFIATRVAYKLDLRGPALTVQSACSTSLVAVAQACQALRAGDADMALAGAVSVTLPQRRGYLPQEGGMVSADGHCRPFDADASGTVFGNGAGAVLLKRLDDALADGDQIHAVIRGVGIANDGAGKVGYAAPSVDGQAEAIVRAQAQAGVAPEAISYVECHGTATPLGDPIEIAALTKAFRRDQPADAAPARFCALGSVKANVGHLDVAAGMAGLIKTVLSLKHRTLPPLLHWRRPNPAIDFAAGPFVPNTARRAWESEGQRLAGVSAFGLGGTNVHLVLEEAPASAPAPAAEAPQLLLLSARTESALAAMRGRLAAHLEAHPETALADVAHTLREGRARFGQRVAIVAAGRDEAAALLRAAAPGRDAAGVVPEVDFMFPGQGAQHPGMGAGLYAALPAYRAAIDECARLLEPLLGLDIRTLLAAARDDAAAAEQLRATRLAQPALFSVSWAAAQAWAALGVRPAAMIGHSIGELVAACVAGVMSLEGALRLVAARGAAMQALPPGRMLAVRLSEAELAGRLPAAVDIAALNGPRSTVLAGPDEAIAAFEAVLAAEGVSSRTLRTSHAFHSAMMDPAIPRLLAVAHSIDLHPPRIPIVSTVTGRWLEAAEATDPNYWARHLRQPVRFTDALATLCAGRDSALVETGAGRTLSLLARQHPAVAPARTVTASLADPAESSGESSGESAGDHAALLEAAGRLWAAGCDLDWSGLGAGSAGRRISLPTYPFERARHWIDAPAGRTPAATAPVPSDTAAISAREAVSMPHQATTDASAPASVPSTATAEAALREALCTLLEDISGIEIASLPEGTTFLEMGCDSLLLTQVVQAVGQSFGVQIAFRQLSGDLGTVDALLHHIAANAPSDRLAALMPAAPAPAAAAAPIPAPAQTTSPMPAAAPAVAPATAEGSVIERVMREQLAAMQGLIQSQLAALGSVAPAVAAAPAAAVPAASVPAPAPAVAAAPRPASVQAQAQAVTEEPGFKPFGPYKPFVRGADTPLTPVQRRFIADLIARSDARTPGSKHAADRYRTVLADPRVAAGFRPEWKDLVYPLTTVRSSGARLWDVDGNDYVDLLNGFGPTAFGHAPDFITDAIAAQLRDGFEIGPMTPLAGEVAALVHELTGNERVTFCNTGSEAVMAAMRLARTVTGRMKIATFGGDYHGQFDEVLIKGFVRDGEPRTTPIAPGIPRESVANMVVLDHGDPKSLEWIRAHAHELAAVLIEPVQSRHPSHQPRAFLHELRRITEAAGTALILDEIVTGFRVHPGGVQALFDVRADLVTYGKVVGGGMPIGILAGTARFMDALDGGAWRYGDDSGPTAGVTFFAGTFVRHPLALAAARAVLLHLRGQGPALQQRLGERADRLTADLNRVLEEAGAPTRVENFGSVLHFRFPPENRFASLFWYLLREHGVHHQEGFPCFLTTAHSEADLAKVVEAFGSAARALRDAGFFGPVEETAAKPAAAPQPASLVSAPLAPATVPVLSGRPTEAQMEIWLASQFGPAASCAFNESVTLTLDGPLDRVALERALRRLVERHDALRMHFARTGETFEVVRGAPVALTVATPGTLAEAVAEEARAPFDLVEGPLVRFVLVPEAASGNRHALVITAHHIVCDGWSTNVLLSEIGPLYAAERTGSAAVLPPAPSFAAYASTAADADEATVAWWLDVYRTLPEPLPLPGDRPRPLEKSYRGGTRRARIDAESLAAIKRAGARQGATLFATLLAGFAALLSRLSGQHDIVVGVPTAAQSALAPEGLVGHCVNFLPLRLAAQGDAPFAAVVKATKGVVLEAYEHQACTLGTLVRRLGIPRDPSRLPLVDVQFNLERVGGDLAFPGIAATVDPNPKAFANFDLFLNAVEGPDGLLIDCDYNADLFDAATIDRWLGHYRTLLTAAAAEMGATVAALPLLGARETDALCAALAGPEAEIPPLGLHEMVEAQAWRTPEALAVLCGERRLDYAALNAAAERLADRLAAAGAGPGVPVAVLLDRSVELPIALLAVLKTGAFYVPLDPANPPARTGMVLEDSGATIVIATADVAAGIAQGRRIVDPTLGEIMPPRPAIVAASEGLAYRIYTSGSTGRPKGVDVPHRAVVNFLRSMAKEPGLTAADTLLAVTTPSFDIAALELFLPLTVGAALAIADSETVRDGNRLAAALAETGATVMQATPATWWMLLEAGWRSRPGFTMLCGGEALPAALARQLLAGGGTLWNMYGPTETTIWSIVERVRDAGPIDFGRPIANTACFVVDEALRLQPPGVPGELCIAGDGLARGYHDRPELTADRFVVPPQGYAPLMYRTGDRARLRADGRLELMGRLDNQIKLRGYRIELGEVEAAVAAALGTPHVAAALAPLAEGDPVLVAYVEGPADMLGDQAELRRAIGETLPAWMVPARFVAIDRLPRTANGKLDRKALPHPNGAVAPAERRIGGVAPRNRTEQVLLEIWRAVLELDGIGVTDDLFALGADSIRAFRIVARAEREGLRFDAAMLLRHRTVERLAAALAAVPAEAGGRRAAVADPPIRRVARDAFRIDGQVSQ